MDRTLTTIIVSSDCICKVKRGFKMEEKSIRSEKIFDGTIVKLRVDSVLLPDGREGRREIVSLSPAVAVLPLLSKEEIVLVKQFRKPVEEILLEIPAGKLEEGEDVIACAKRELKEETGYKAKKVEKVLEFYPSPGVCDELIHVLIASGLEEGEQRADRDEFIEKEIVKLSQVPDLIKEGRIKDGKTLIALLFYMDHLCSET